MGKGIQSDVSYPLYTCSTNNISKTKVYFKSANTMFAVNTLVNTFTFYNLGKQVTKIIFSIEFLFLA